MDTPLRELITCIINAIFCNALALVDSFSRKLGSVWGVKSASDVLKIQGRYVITWMELREE